MPSAVVSEPAKQDVSEAFIGERRAANPALGLPIPIATRFVWVGTMSSYSAGELAAFDERMPTIHAAVVGHTSGLFPHTTLVLRRNLVIEMSSDITFEWFLRLLVQLEAPPAFAMHRSVEFTSTFCNGYLVKELVSLVMLQERWPIIIRVSRSWLRAAFRR